MAAQTQIPSEQKETREKTISHTSLQKTQNKEFLSINACYSVTKYYLCRQNNKRSLLGRKQQSQVARSFPNRYLFSYTNKVTSLFSISCILDIILESKSNVIVLLCPIYCNGTPVVPSAILSPLRCIRIIIDAFPSLFK